MQHIRVERRHVEQMILAIQDEIYSDVFQEDRCHPIVEDEVRRTLEDIVSREMLGVIHDDHSFLRDLIADSARRRLG